jgi:hypothetical protein
VNWLELDLLIIMFVLNWVCVNTGIIAGRSPHTNYVLPGGMHTVAQGTYEYIIS